MRVQNEIDRYHLIIDALSYIDKLGDRKASLVQWCKNKLVEHNEYIREYGEDLPEIINWKWEDNK